MLEFVGASDRGSGSGKEGKGRGLVEVERDVKCLVPLCHLGLRS
jgi:hypothetical protein